MGLLNIQPVTYGIFKYIYIYMYILHVCTSVTKIILPFTFRPNLGPTQKATQ